MPRKRFLFLFLLLPLILTGVIPALGQESSSPLVVFVLNPDIDSASPFDPGPNGLSALRDIFRNAGAQVQAVDLVEAVPANAEVLVLVGPRKPLSIYALARLWVHMSRGHNLLLALDPSGYGDTDTENYRSGLVQFLNNAYGVTPSDAFMAEDWFTKNSILLLSGALMRTHADVIPHPIVEPLLQYDLSVEVWAARPVQVEPLGVFSHAFPLLQTSTAFGETNADVFTFADDFPPLELNLGNDIIGRVNIAGAGENTRSGSRVVVLGDSEILLNGYGLATEPGTTSARHLGNRIFAERTADWLLELPEDQWSPLPGNLTWIAVDGVSDDWDVSQPSTSDGLDTFPTNYNLRAARALKDDTYLYILAQTVTPPTSDIQVDFQLTDADTPITITANTQQVTMIGQGGELVLIPDAKLAVGNAVEIRLPLRILSGVRNITDFCARPNADAASDQADCMNEAIPINQVDTHSPSDLHFPEGPVVVVTSARSVVLRDGPDVLGTALTTFDSGKMLSAIGRTPESDWIQVQTGAYTGWIFSSFVIANTDIDTLPIVEPAQTSP